MGSMAKRRTESSVMQDEAWKQRGFHDYVLRVGDVMRGERATLGKSIEDVQRELRIDASYLQAIENVDLSVFEVPGFAAGYIRSYARYLNIDPEWAYQAFCDEGGFENGQEGLPAIASRPAEVTVDAHERTKSEVFNLLNTPFTKLAKYRFFQIDPKGLGSLVILFVLIAFIGYGGWGVLKEIQRAQFTLIDETLDAGGQVNGLGAEDELGVAGLSDTSPASNALDQLYRPETLPVPVLTVRDAPISTLDPDKIATIIEPERHKNDSAIGSADSNALGVANAAFASGAVPVLSQSQPTVTMVAVDPAWVRVRAADGIVIFEKVLDAGESYVLPQTNEAPSLRAGNSGSLYFSIGGEVYGPAGSSTSVVRNVLLSIDAIKENYEVADLNENGELARVVTELQALVTGE